MMDEATTRQIALDAATEGIRDRDREIEVLTTERDNALLEVEDRERELSAMLRMAQELQGERDNALLRVDRLEDELATYHAEFGPFVHEG